MDHRLMAGLAAALACTTLKGAVADDDHHRLEPHFSHPLISESPTPDTKVRLDYLFFDKETGVDHTFNFEGEYAPVPWASLEIGVPLTVSDPDGAASVSNLDTVEVALKLAAPLSRNVLFGGGIEFGLPTGDDPKGIGSNNELEIEPFLDMGIKSGPFEAIGFLKFGIPVNQDPYEADEVDLEIGFNAAFLYEVYPGVRAILEFDGETVAIGHEEESVVNVTPGVKVRPFQDSTFEIGAGVGFPLTHDEKFNVRAIVAGFYHF